jgi:UDP-N-acetylglucosamine 4,6-dehydratase
MPSWLITGSTGSFGRAFVKRLLGTPEATRICVFSRGEHAQAAMRAELQNDPRLRFFVGDVRDRDRLRRAMEGVDTVIHAAALKRIEVGFYNPSEMVRTNVLGAMNVIEAAQDAGVRKVVALSSDKAYQPISAYGQSKALMESLMLAANHTRGANGPIFAVTRYGNVAGSAGSVIPIWRATDYPLITDSECTRFWMTMDEAIDLVLNTVRTMKGGELAIPTLPAYRLGDLLVAMGKNPAEQVGLNAYEKKHESMCDGNSSEHARRMSILELRGALEHV